MQITGSASIPLLNAQQFAGVPAAMTGTGNSQTGAPSSTTPSPAPVGLKGVDTYMQEHGATQQAAAGITGVIAGEDPGANPETNEFGGGGGKGLIQWTSPTVPSPNPNIQTGNPAADMNTQLGDASAYINQRGGMASLDAAPSAMSAAQDFSAMEGPATPGSDIRPNVVQQASSW